MEAQEEVTTQNIVKGKRTKRQRVQSPIPFALTTNSSSGGDGFVGDDCTNIGGVIKVWSPTSSNELCFQDNATEEEEDMANCLILLAQGHSRDHDLRKHQLHQDNNIDSGFYSNNNNSNVKFNSRRFLETGPPGSGKAGYYVYECKTCSRSFPSFQALGGHRASHKKPKAAMNNNVVDHEQKSQLMALSSDEEDGQYKNMSSSLSLQLSNSNTNRSIYQSSNNQNNGNKSKIHECSICGAEFTSGQALGGHMRRHRGPIGGGNSSALSLTPLAIESEEAQKGRNLISLDLDLNLPAPEDDKLMHFASKQQQQQQEKKSPPIVFSSPALVDCHY